MSIKPMKKCNDCGCVFDIVSSSVKKCPKCQSENLKGATALDLLNTNE